MNVRRSLLPSAMFALAAIIGLATSSTYLLQQGTILWCFALAVVGLAFAINVSGEFLLAQGAVFALSGYAAAISTGHWHAPYIVGLAVGAVFAVLLGTLVGLGALRTTGWYFAMASFFLAAIVPNIIDLFPSLTGAETGLFGVPVANFGGAALSQRGVYFLALAILVICTAGIGFLRETRLGTVMAIMRERRAAAASLGSNPTVLRLIVFVVCSIPAGLGGALYAHLYGFVQPTLFPLNQTILFFSAVVIGGRRLAGSLVAITVLFAIPLILLGAGSDKDIVYSLVILAVAILVAHAPRVRGWLVVFATDERAAHLVARIPNALRRLHQRPAAATPDVSSFSADRAVELLQPVVPAPAELRADGISVTFGLFAAVNFASSDAVVVPASSVHALLGANGSGKTTLLNAISGHVPSRGEVHFGDDRGDAVSASSRARLGLGRSWQSPALPPELTPVRLLVAGLTAPTNGSGVKLSRKAAETTALRALEAVGLGELANVPASRLSSAHRRWVDLLVAISRPARFVILDEPGAGLTRAERQGLAALIEALAVRGLGVLLIEHDLDLATKVAHSVTVLDRGAPIYQGEPSRVREDPQVRTSFLGRVDDVRSQGGDPGNDRMRVSR